MNKFAMDRRGFIRARHFLRQNHCDLWDQVQDDDGYSIIYFANFVYEKDLEKNEDPIVSRRIHKKWMENRIIVESDYELYGGNIKRWETPDKAYPDCSSGCKHFKKLDGELGSEWGVCSNPNSERCGMLTFEHQNGFHCFEGE